MKMKALILAMAWAGIVNFFMPVSMAVDANCDFYQQMVLGQEYYIYNPQYPQSYQPSTSCRWRGSSPPGTSIVLSCNEINLPSSTNCQYDRLAISLTGDPNFNDAQNYCGQGSLTLITEGNALAVGLFVPGSTPGGRFICSLTAIQTDPTTTTESPQVCDCGWRQTTRIVGGKPTGINEFPAMAALIDVSKRIPYCGSTIISDRYAVTAAHCLTNQSPSGIGLLVGDYNVTSSTDTPYAALYKIIQFIIHPEYYERYYWNDIALVKTELIIKFSVYVGPICLPFRFTTDDFYGETVIALGWGALGVSEQDSDTLMMVDLGIVSNSYCNQSLDDPIIPTQICTYADGKDSCVSDSGGPLLWQDPRTSRLQLIGTISFGFSCGTIRPAVNTRVTSYLSWIISETSDATYCIK